MSWGIGFFYYVCPNCEKKFKYAQDMIACFGDEVGLCPKCQVMGTYVKDGPRGKDDIEYFEVEE